MTIIGDKNIKELIGEVVSDSKECKSSPFV